MSALATILPNLPPGGKSLLPTELQSLIAGATATVSGSQSEVATVMAGASQTQSGAAANVFGARDLWKRKGGLEVFVGMMGVVVGGLVVLL